MWEEEEEEEEMVWVRTPVARRQLKAQSHRRRHHKCHIGPQLSPHTLRHLLLLPLTNTSSSTTTTSNNRTTTSNSNSSSSSRSRSGLSILRLAT